MPGTAQESAGVGVTQANAESSATTAEISQ